MILENIYSKPYRVYICFLLLIIAGIVCYYSMPIALFPNSSRPEVELWIPFDNYTKDGFLNTYGKSIEANLKRLQTPLCEVEEVRSYYKDFGTQMKVLFNWGINI